MEQRKSDKANLEKTRWVFKGVGFAIIGAVIFVAFSFKNYDQIAYKLTLDIDEDLMEIPLPVLPPEQIQEVKPPPPPKKKEEPKIDIVDDEEETPELEDNDEEEDEIEEVDETEEEPEELDDTPVIFVKNMPYYDECKDLKGGARNKCTMNALRNKIAENFVMPDIAKQMGLSGTVYVQFVMGKDGKPRDVKIKKGVHEILDNAAIKAVQKLPRINPGMKLDKPVSVLYTVPVKVTY